MALMLLRYGEIALKSRKIRRSFEERLIDNIMNMLMEAQISSGVRHEQGRIFLEVGDDDVDAVVSILKRTFGLVSFSVVQETTSKREDIGALAAEMSHGMFKPGASFAVKVKRNGQHPYTSMELGRDVGSDVYKANEEMNPKVNLTNPDIEIFVEVRNNRAYIFSEKIQGPGGMPVGTQGRIFAYVPDENGMMAAWLMLKRGCSVVCATDSEEKVAPLRRWCGNLKTVEMTDGDWKSEIPKIAKESHSIAISLPTTYPEISDDMLLADPDFPVFYPLVGMDEKELKILKDKIKAEA